MQSRAAVAEPAPQGDGDVVADYVFCDIQERVLEGTRRYGTPLRTDNSRDALWDAYQEAIDLVFYLRQAILERDNDKTKLGDSTRIQGTR